MGRKSRAKKKNKQNNPQTNASNLIKKAASTKTVLTPDLNIMAIIKNNWKLLVLFSLINLIVYFNSLDNQLTLVDDMQAFVQNESIKDLAGTFKQHSLFSMVYATSYHFFGYNPLPLRIVAVTLHILTTILVFITAHILFDKKTAVIATLVFAVHAVNTEAVTWISGGPYLYLAFFIYITILLYLKFKATQKIRYLILALILYVGEIYLIGTPWLLVVPVVLVVIDQLLIENKFDVTKLWWIILFAIPISFYLVTKFSGMYSDRLFMRSEGGKRKVLNQQALTPVVEGYPYSTFMMTKLYTFPLTLNVYYDGNKVTTLTYICMYVTFIAYVSLIIYYLFKNRKIAGLLIIMPVLLAPVYSPIKITWFMSERYMYAGTGFFGMLVAYYIDGLEQKINRKILYTIFGLVLVLLAIRTYLRNNDWQDTITLSYASMKSAPLSVRPYNDIGGHYYYKGDMETAVFWYEEALKVLPSSGTAINNLGYIYLNDGPLIFRDDFIEPEQNKENSELFYGYAVKLKSVDGDFRTISYFINKAIALDMDNINYLINLGDFYRSFNKLEYSLKVYKFAESLDKDNPMLQDRIAVTENLLNQYVQQMY